MSEIHPTALIDSSVRLGKSVRVGPYTVVESGVSIGDETVIGPHCHLLGQTVIGRKNRIHAGCVIGDDPQDATYRTASSQVCIGDENRIREHVTIHRGAKEGTATVIGNHNFLMAHSHVAHNVRLGDHIVLANGVLLAGYVDVGDRAFLGGGAVVHQFCRVGTLSILRGLSRISKDVPPYCMAVESNELVGLNVIGLKRAGFSLEQRNQLKKAYVTLFLSGLNISQALEQLSSASMTTEVQTMVEQIRLFKRGSCVARISDKNSEMDL